MRVFLLVALLIVSAGTAFYLYQRREIPLPADLAEPLRKGALRVSLRMSMAAATSTAPSCYAGDDSPTEYGPNLCAIPDGTCGALRKKVALVGGQMGYAAPVGGR